MKWKRRWERLRDALVALSLANVILIGAWFPILYDTDYGYFDKNPTARCVILALATNLICIAVLFYAVMRLLRRNPNRWLRLVANCLFLALLLLPLNFVRVAVFSFSAGQVLVFLRQPLVLLGVAVTVTLLVWQHRRATVALAVLLGILSPLALLGLGRIALLSVGLTHLPTPGIEPPAPPLLPMRDDKPRVVWIIFDESDQRVIFERRPERVKLPEFDRLRNDSLYATNAYPPENYTLASMPGLISGIRLAVPGPVNASDLQVIRRDTGKTTTWRQLPSVFASVRDLGFNTALIGWYHPYSRLFGQALNFCLWYPGFYPAQATTFRSAMAAQLTSLTKSVTIRKLFADACRDGLAEATTLVTNRTYGLVLLHLPPPHVPGVYDPERDVFTTKAVSVVTGYFNNLILADRSLGRFRRELDGSSAGTNTWLIVSADHAWRKSRLYDGGRDLRVPFMIKPPGEAHGAVYSPKINTVLTHDFILAILRGAVTAQNISEWLNGHRNGEGQEEMPKEFPGRESSRRGK